LLAAAEQLIEEAGVDVLSVRTVAARVGTSTRAVYSVFGSKEGLLGALGVRAFEMLGAGVAALPTTDNPPGDLVEAGLTVFRRFVVEHPALFRIAMQRTPAWKHVPNEVRGAAAVALTGLRARIVRIKDAGLLRRLTVDEAMFAFHALCEGVAAAELRGQMPPDETERIWRATLGTLVAGFAAAAPSSAEPGSSTGAPSAAEPHLAP